MQMCDEIKFLIVQSRLSLSLDSYKINLPVEKLTAGVYTVAVKSGSDVQAIKFVKE